MTDTPHCDRFLRDADKPTLTTEDRKKVHHLLHALAVGCVDLPVLLRSTVYSMRDLEATGRLTWSWLLHTRSPNAAQVVWIVGHAAGLLKKESTHTSDGHPRYTVPDYAALLTALDDTVTLWRAGKLIEPEPRPETAPTPAPESTAALRLANLDAPWDPARVFADTDEAKANMEAAIAAMADPWYQPFSRKDFILRGPVEQTDARKALLSFAIDVDALNLDRDSHGDVIYSVLNASTFHSKVRTRIAQKKSMWRRLEA